MKKVLVLLAAFAIHCTTATPPSPEQLRSAAASVPAFAIPDASNEDAEFIGAGDIADARFLTDAAATGAIINRFPTATVFTLGDNAYRDGTDADFANNYNPTWGSFLDRTKPSPGNHDYKTSGAAGYFRYFGIRAGPPGLGWYSYDLKGWHIISLNSEHVGDAAQLAWLENDLKETTKPCIIAYWHHPLFSSGGEHGDQSFDKGRRTDRFWRLLLARGADVVLNGHDHDYERFDPQNSSGASLASGLREFVVGTGGGERRTLGTRKNHSVFFDKDRRGVLLMTLHPNSYEWRFLATDGTTPDSSSARVECLPKHQG
jgi:acid phosphatase type 7